MCKTTCSFLINFNDPQSESSLLARRAIFEALIEGPLLLDQLPESGVFDRYSLQLPDPLPDLNFRQKLGHLYEEALACLLENSDRFDLLGRNLQLQIDRHQTVGELDFLLRDLKTGQLIHLELATKFYLAVETEGGLALPGPDARDNYFKKLDRLRFHQLTLASRYRHLIPAPGKEEPIVSKHLVLGLLFDHVDSTSPVQPEFVSAEARHGRWLTIDELPMVYSPETELRIIPKPLWPASVESLTHLPLETFDRTKPLDRCVMVATPDHLPLFITPSNYPDHTTHQTSWRGGTVG
jgi:hypothetical protein